MGFFFLIWSLGSILLLIFTPLEKIYYLKDNVLIISHFLFFKEKISLNETSNYEIKKVSFFDRKYDTYRAEIITKNDFYFELYGLKSKAQFENIMKKFPLKKSLNSTQKKSAITQKREFDLNFLKKIDTSSLFSRNIIKIVGGIVLLALIIFFLNSDFTNNITEQLEGREEVDNIPVGEVKIDEIIQAISSYDNKIVTLEGKVSKIISTINTPSAAGEKFGTVAFILYDGSGKIDIIALHKQPHELSFDPDLTTLVKLPEYDNLESIKITINKGDKLRVTGKVAYDIELRVNAINIVKIS